MAAEIEITIEGMEKLLAKTRGTEKWLGPPLRRMLERMAFTIEGRAARFSPYEFGRLQASWRHTLDAQPIPLSATIGSSVLYAKFLEFSDPPKKPRRMGRIPFLRPAFEESQGDIQGFAETATQEIKAAWG